MSQPLDEKTIPLGKMVVLQFISKSDDESKLGGLYLLDAKSSENYRVVKGKVVSVGEDARKIGILPGHFVLYDKHSVFATGHYTNGMRANNEFVITDCINIICQLIGE